MQSTDIIQDWHIHVYYDEGSKSTAEAVRAEVETGLPGLTIGRMHDKPVGPHPHKAASRCLCRMTGLLRLLRGSP